MIRWLATRLAQAIVTGMVAVTIAFFLMRAAPGDPLIRLGDDRALSPEQTAALRARYALDQPLIRQFSTFARGVARGDFGVSIEHGRPVAALIAERLPATALLGGTVLLVTFALGTWLGALQAVRRGRLLDRALGGASLAAYAMPSFWLGLVLAWLFGVEWRILPASGMRDPLLSDAAGGFTRALDLARHLVLPAATLVIVNIGATMRHQRSAMLEALALPFVRAARARGLAEPRVVWHHGWRNAVFPVITLFGLWLPLLVAGSVFVEKIFAWPGLGALAADAIGARDYPLLMGATMLVTVLVIAGAVIADLAYAALDPRVRRA